MTLIKQEQTFYYERFSLKITNKYSYEGNKAKNVMRKT